MLNEIWGNASIPHFIFQPPFTLGINSVEVKLLTIEIITLYILSLFSVHVPLAGFDWYLVPRLSTRWQPVAISDTPEAQTCSQGCFKVLHISESEWPFWRRGTSTQTICLTTHGSTEIPKAIGGFVVNLTFVSNDSHTLPQNVSYHRSLVCRVSENESQSHFGNLRWWWTLSDSKLKWDIHFIRAAKRCTAAHLVLLFCAQRKVVIWYKITSIFYFPNDHYAVALKTAGVVSCQFSGYSRTNQLTEEMSRKLSQTSVNTKSSWGLRRGSRVQAHIRSVFPTYPSGSQSLTGGSNQVIWGSVSNTITF